MFSGGLHLQGGSLEVCLLNGFTPGLGDSFAVFNAPSISGSFGLLTLPALENGLYWDTSALYSQGVLTSIPEVSSCAVLMSALALFGALTVQRLRPVRRRRNRENQAKDSIADRAFPG